MLKHFASSVLIAIAVGGCLAMLLGCDPLQPPDGTPECPSGTVATVCRQLNTATCHPTESLDDVTGCYVAPDPDDPRIKLVCVAPAACD